MDARAVWKVPPHALLVVLCATLVTLPLWGHGPSCGHDFDFHLQSWFAADALWSHGAHPGEVLLRWPHWVPAANYNAGEPRLVFYPPVSWLLGAGLGKVLPWALVPQAFSLVALSGCGLAFYALARRWLPGGLAALSACVYLANPYLLFVAYERTAYGELLGAIFIPLVLLWALGERPPVLRLACAMAALWFSNAPAAVMGCYLAGYCGLAAAISARRLLPLVRVACATALGVGLASVYIVPAWYEQRWVEIARAVGPGMRVEDSFLFDHSGEPFHDQVLHTASWIAVILLGVGLAALGAYWAFGAFARRRDELKPLPQRRVRPPASALGILLLLLLALLLRWSEPVWHLAPELAFLQFPWRWLLVVGVVATLSLALLTNRLRLLDRHRRRAEARKRLPQLAAAIAICLSAWGAGLYAQQHYAQPCDDEDNVSAQRTLVPPSDPTASLTVSTPGFEGTDEYTARGADNGEIQQGLPVMRLLASPEADEGDDTQTPNPDWTAEASIPGTDAHVITWQPEDKRVTVVTQRPAYAVLRLMDYPAWQVTLNGRPAPHLHREDGLLTLALPAGESHLAIKWQATPDVLAGRGLSAGSLLLLAAVAITAHRRRHSLGPDTQTPANAPL